MTDAPELIQICTTDLVAITRGRSVPADAAGWREAGCGWVPANIAMDPDGLIATPNPWGSSGDMRLRPDPATELRVEGIPGRPPLRFVLADIVTYAGADWDCCPRAFLRAAIADLAAAGLSLTASFEHEFVLLDGGPAAPPFSIAAQRRAEPLLTELFAALRMAGTHPEMILPEYGAGQIEVNLAPCDALAAADRAVMLREVVRDLAAARGRAVTFSPKPRPVGVGNGVHIHFSLRATGGEPITYDPSRPGGLSLRAGRFAAGIVRHMAALCAITAPAPVSYLRLVPHHWSAAFACLGERNREAALRICPLRADAPDPARAFNLEYRPADTTANPYLALGALIRAGLAGVRDELPAPPLVNTDPADFSEAERAALGVTRLPDSLANALDCLAGDAEVSSWFSRDLLGAFLGVKRREIAAVQGMAAEAVCGRYRAIY